MPRPSLKLATFLVTTTEGPALRVGNATTALWLDAGATAAAALFGPVAQESPVGDSSQRTKWVWPPALYRLLMRKWERLPPSRQFRELRPCRRSPPTVQSLPP